MAENDKIKGWAGILNGQSENIPVSESDNEQEEFITVPTHEKIHESNYASRKLSPEEFYQHQVKDEQDAADAEKALHDNFEKLMKDSEKQDQTNGIKR
jgi:hypothetical protein